MMGVQGRNFLAWHRWFIRQFKKTLQKIDASVSLPYWDAITDRQIPQALDNPALLTKWSVSRSWNPSSLPTSANIDRIWSKWQVGHVGQDPANLAEKLKPTPIFKVKVQDALNIATLGYSYQ